MHYITTPLRGVLCAWPTNCRGSNRRHRGPIDATFIVHPINFQFVIPEPPLRGRMDVVKAESDNGGAQNALTLQISSGGERKNITLLGKVLQTHKGFVLEG